MVVTNTIPGRLPEETLNDLTEGRYDNVILFVLAVFGPHRFDELVNNPNNSVNNRMEENCFHQFEHQLIIDNCIQKYTKFGDIYYKITSKGEDLALQNLENTPAVVEFINTYNEILGISEKTKEMELKSTSKYRIRYKDYVFGLLSLVWRLDSFSKAAEEIKNIKPELNVSVGKCLENNAEKFANNNAILYENIKYTYKELNECINQYANYFLSLGVKKGDVFNVFIENRPELLFIIGAMSKIGTIGSLINTRQKSKTLIHSLKLNPVNIYLIGEELIESFEEVKSELGLSGKERLYFVPDEGKMQVPNDYIDLKEVLKNEDKINPPTTNNIKGKETYAFIFTSGTTGMPKAAHMRNVHTVGSISSWGGMVMYMQPDDILYCSLPLFHSNAIQIGWASAIWGGAALAIARKFSVSNFWKDVRKFRATCFNYIGEICRYLYNKPPTAEDRNHNVYKICGNGLQPEIWKEFKERFGIREVFEHYGMTEMKSMFCNYLNLDCTVGFNFMKYVIVKYDIENEEPIRGEGGYLQEVNEGEAGLILIEMESEYTFAGYTNKEANKKKLINNAFKQGDWWYITGDALRDIGFKHAQFVDRLGDTFRWKGENVSTTEVEEILSPLEEISHSSVYGVEIPGTEGRASMASIISTTEHTKFEFTKVLQILNSSLPKYAIPLFIRFLSDLSTTSTYKIQKRKLKNEGYNITKINDPIYILLPNNSEYKLMTKEIFENLRSGVYPF